jgi:arabinose-5-phosphate isomerase
MDAATILQRARRVLEIEAREILSLVERLDGRLVGATDLLYRCQGKVVVTGLGKSGIIARKIAATFSSTGTPSFFLHAAEGVHGDLGMLMKEDVVLALSNSGETEDLLTLLPIIKRFGLKLIVLTGNPGSTLARAGDVVLDVGVKEEGCPLGLSPMASTTAALAMGDVLAVLLLERKGFKAEDFALRHPGGILGRRLLMRVQDLMHVGSKMPVVEHRTPIKETLLEITSKRLGVTGVVNERGELVGIITDGDLRRGLERQGDIFRFTAADLMTTSPKTIAADALAATAVAVMEEHSITSLFVLEPGGRKPIGIVHLHDLLKAGIAGAV